MWFTDPNHTKNKKYYTTEIEKIRLVDSQSRYNLFYGESLFKEIFNRIDIWNELTNYLQKYKEERSTEILSVPSFDDSEEMFLALLKLKTEDTGLYKKLISNKEEYIQLRKELFPTQKNLNKIKGIL